jgi:hypothetical protein
VKRDIGALNVPAHCFQTEKRVFPNAKIPFPDPKIAFPGGKMRELHVQDSARGRAIAVKCGKKRKKV